MSRFVFRGLRHLLGLVLMCFLMSVSCHPYRIPNPTGPPQPKVRKAKNVDSEAADGRDMNATTEVKPMKNSYDKNGILKKPKYKNRRLKKKVGQHKFLGITLPF